MNQLMMREVIFRHPQANNFKLQPVSLTLSAGLYYLLGNNGSGKTTLLKGLAGIAPVYGGNLRLILDNRPMHIAEYKRYMGYSPQEVAIHPQLTVHQYLKYIARMRLLPESAIGARIRELIRQFGLSEDAGAKTGQLSVGKKKRLMLAQAMLADPKLLLVDEPFAHIDIEGQAQMRSWLAEEGQRRIIIAAHHPSDGLAVEGNVLTLREGRLCGP